MGNFDYFNERNDQTAVKYIFKYNHCRNKHFFFISPEDNSTINLARLFFLITKILDFVLHSIQLVDCIYNHGKLLTLSVFKKLQSKGGKWSFSDLILSKENQDEIVYLLQ